MRFSFKHHRLKNSATTADVRNLFGQSTFHGRLFSRSSFRKLNKTMTIAFDLRLTRERIIRRK